MLTFADKEGRGDVENADIGGKRGQGVWQIRTAPKKCFNSFDQLLFFLGFLGHSGIEGKAFANTSDKAREGGWEHADIC